MEDRRCRKILSLLVITAVLLLSLGVQNVYASPVKSGGTFYNRVLDLKEILMEYVVSDIKEIIISGVDDKGLIEVWLGKVEDGGIGQEQNIRVVIEQIPLEEVQKKLDSTRKNTDLKVLSYSRGIDFRKNKEDLELLARIIHAEARGETFEGQVAVGAVVLNRVKHPRFPQTIREVIYQPGQFTAVTDRQIELPPDSKAYLAAEAALEGQDPTNGALYYYNPKLATDKWIRTRMIVKSIGNHHFCV